MTDTRVQIPEMQSDVKLAYEVADDVGEANTNQTRVHQTGINFGS